MEAKHVHCTGSDLQAFRFERSRSRSRPHMGATAYANRIVMSGPSKTDRHGGGRPPLPSIDFDARTPTAPGGKSQRRRHKVKGDCTRIQRGGARTNDQPNQAMGGTGTGRQAGGRASKLVWREGGRKEEDKEWYGVRVLTLARSCCGWSSGSASDLGRVLQLRGSGGPWPCRLAAYRTDADRSNAPPPRCPSTSAAAAASASSSMVTDALAESLPPPPPPRPREEVEERRLACGGGDPFPDWQGSERQDTSEPIGAEPGRFGRAFGAGSQEILALTAAAAIQEGSREGARRGGGGGRNGRQAGRARAECGRGSNAMQGKRIRKFILLLVPPILHIGAPCSRNFAHSSLTPFSSFRYACVEFKLRRHGCVAVSCHRRRVLLHPACFFFSCAELCGQAFQERRKALTTLLCVFSRFYTFTPF
jgi:hypothetical protein